MVIIMRNSYLVYNCVSRYIYVPQNRRLSRRGVSVSGAVRGKPSYRRDYRTAIGKSDRLFWYCTSTEDIKHFG
jgi:hypothetical protein